MLFDDNTGEIPVQARSPKQMCQSRPHTEHCLRQPCLHLLQASKQEVLCYKKPAEDMEKDQWCKFTLYLCNHHSA